MVKNKLKTLPKLNSVNALADLFDNNDFGNVWEQMPEAKFEIDLKTHKHLVEIEEDVVIGIEKIAKAEHISSANLINSWLKERLQSVKV
jgi:hypothetical protein